MTGIHFEIKDRSEIERFGFEYAADENKCTGHMFNNIPLELDFRDDPDYKLEDIENDLDVIFRSVLRSELQDAGVKKLRHLSWDRIFQIGPLWNPRQFTAIFYVRILGEDAEAGKDNHVCRA